ncbi:MAG TPA: sigma-70 family RNA polymerase sigma factor [Saprospiraceae bacterium]|nr:sigma-70 family RNA polymerase sigma factor [Saprospiraceae bacterium]
MRDEKLAAHLFRHQYGRMVSILTRIFGLAQLEMVEDAVQDTFAKALLSWRNKVPENPEAWLVAAAKNRAIDLLRKAKSDQFRIGKVPSGPATVLLNELFLENEVEDSQLRMVFTACHPALKPTEQIAFALKTISGFGIREIASALLLKEETVKKRLSRARKTIVQRSISFAIPNASELPARLDRVLEVLYLTFNEGFHSNNKAILIRRELCGEAIRLCRLLLTKESLRTGKVYALFAIMCFHAARLDSRVDGDGEIVDIKHQDRSKWYLPLINLGHSAMMKATTNGQYSAYHYEAAIAAEHLRAETFEATDWTQILHWYDQLLTLQDSAFTRLNKSVVLMQLGDFAQAKKILDDLVVGELAQRKYLYHSAYAEYYFLTGHPQAALKSINRCLELVNSEPEKRYFERKKTGYKSDR